MQKKDGGGGGGGVVANVERVYQTWVRVRVPSVKSESKSWIMWVESESESRVMSHLKKLKEKRKPYT